ncbi:MAG: hypothetical protein ACLRSW_10550 [Christensenellaceae bacterium]
MKKLILVTSPPACGKTYISKELSKRLKHIVYLDKDSLIPLSKQIFLAAGEEYNRSSPFLKIYPRLRIRDGGNALRRSITTIRC